MICFKYGIGRGVYAEFVSTLITETSYLIDTPEVAEDMMLVGLVFGRV